MPSRRDMRKRYLGILLVALCVSGCTGTKQVDSLQKFAQNGQRTLFEVTDKGGRFWKVGSVKAPGITAYFVVNSDGRVNVVATAFDDRLGAKHAIVFVDPTDKEEALAVLDRKFLSGVGNASDAYRKWVDQDVIFTYGSVQDTRRFDMGKGGLGTTDIGVAGNTIAGLMKNVDCHCDDPGMFNACQQHQRFEGCINKICDYVNCVVGIINGSGSNCANEAFAAVAICESLNGVSQ